MRIIHLLISIFLFANTSNAAPNQFGLPQTQSDYLMANNLVIYSDPDVVSILDQMAEASKRITPETYISVDNPDVQRITALYQSLLSTVKALVPLYMRGDRQPSEKALKVLDFKKRREARLAIRRASRPAQIPILRTPKQQPDVGTYSQRYSVQQVLQTSFDSQVPKVKAPKQSQKPVSITPDYVEGETSLQETLPF